MGAREKSYVFDGPTGKETLPELFAGRSQLIVYHFMFGPSWEEGCKSCSFWADNFNGIIVHLNQRDVTMVAISRAPFPKLDAFRKRMGWSFKWLSSFASDFNRDYHVSFTEAERATEVVGISVFHKDASEDVFHTYSCYARGVDMMNGAYHYLDLVPKGRDEGDQKPHPQAWVRHHDKYGV